MFLSLYIPTPSCLRGRETRLSLISPSCLQLASCSIVTWEQVATTCRGWSPAMFPSSDTDPYRPTKEPPSVSRGGGGSARIWKPPRWVIVFRQLPTSFWGSHNKSVCLSRFHWSWLQRGELTVTWNHLSCPQLPLGSMNGSRGEPRAKKGSVIKIRKQNVPKAWSVTDVVFII